MARTSAEGGRRAHSGAGGIAPPGLTACPGAELRRTGSRPAPHYQERTLAGAAGSNVRSSSRPPAHRSPARADTLLTEPRARARCGGREAVDACCTPTGDCIGDGRPAEPVRLAERPPAQVHTAEISPLDPDRIADVGAGGQRGPAIGGRRRHARTVPVRTDMTWFQRDVVALTPGSALVGSSRQPGSA